MRRTFTAFIMALTAGDVTDDTGDLLPSATLVVLFKKTEAEMEALRQKQSQAYRQPHRPLEMGNTILKIAASYVLAKVQPSVGVSAGAHNFVVN